MSFEVVHVVVVEPQGPQGVPGPPGPNTFIFHYTYQSQTTPPPGAGAIRTDGATAEANTVLYVDAVDKDGTDVLYFLGLVKSGEDVYLQDSTDSSCYAVYTVNSDPVLNGITPLAAPPTGGSGNYLMYSVTFKAKGPTQLSGNKPDVIFCPSPT